MKPRFSILGLLGVTFFVAHAVAATVYQQDLLVRTLFVLTWLLTVAYFLALAIGSSNRRVRAFCAALLACTALYLLLPHCVPGLAREMPDEQLYRWIRQTSGARPVVFPYTNLTPREFPLEVDWPVTLSSAFACGLLGGFLTLWRYRVSEWRERQAP